MIELRQLVSYTDDFLTAHRFQDYCPNGLQVEGRSEVRRIVSGVTSCLDCVEAAVERNADALLVHHGLFWNKESPVVTGMKARRLRRLLSEQISLLAYHLPLDAHPEIGNNARLATLLPVGHCEWVGEPGQPALFMHGILDKSMGAEALKHLLARQLRREPLLVHGGKHEIRTVGWCTGAAQDLITVAVRHHLDAFISGEISERTTHIAREEGIHYFAAGHHATERYGVESLGEHLAERFSLEHHFVDIDNPA